MSKIRKSAKYKGFIIEQEAETNKVSVVCKNTSQVLRDIADEIGMSYESDWGPYYLGSRLINFINGVDTTRKPKLETPNATADLIQQNGSVKSLAFIGEAEYDGIIIRRKKNRPKCTIHYGEQHFPRILEEVGKEVGLSDLSGDVETLAKRIVKHKALSKYYPQSKMYLSDITQFFEGIELECPYWEAIIAVDFKDGDYQLDFSASELMELAGFEYDDGYEKKFGRDYYATCFDKYIKFINFLNGVSEPEDIVYTIDDIDAIKQSAEYKGLLVECQLQESGESSLNITLQDKMAFLRTIADCAKLNYDLAWNEKELTRRVYDFLADKRAEQATVTYTDRYVIYLGEQLQISVYKEAKGAVLQQVVEASGFQRNPEWSDEYTAYRLMIFLHGFKTDEQIGNAIFGDDHEEYMLPSEDQNWWFNLPNNFKYILLSNLREEFEDVGDEFPSWDDDSLGEEYGIDLYNFYNTPISGYLQDFIIGYRDENGEYDYDSADLSYLSVPDNIYDIDDLSPLARLKNIKHFSFAEWEGYIGEEMLESLSKFTHLEKLNLSNNEVDEDALNKLASLTNLESLYLEDCDIDEDSEALEELRDALPDCEIIL